MSEIAKKRALRLKNDSDSLKIDRFIKALRELKGVNDVLIDGTMLTVRYNLKKARLIHFEEVMKEHGLEFEHGVIAWFIRGWIHFIEENEYNNSRRLPSSCSG